MDNPFSKDLQAIAIQNARRCQGDRLGRIAAPHRCGGAGRHGYRALEGAFLGGCLFSGRETGRALARLTAS